MADTCPKCGFVGVESDRCRQCGVVVALYEASLQKLRRGPVGPIAPAASPASSASSASPALSASPASTVFTAPRPVAAPRTALAAPTPTIGATAARRRLTFHGSGGALFGIQIVNACLTLLTLGVYYFWGKVRVRAYLLSQTEFEGDRFAYHGTGRELLVGALKATAVFFVPVLALQTLPDLLDAPGPVRVSAAVAVYAIVMVFLPVAMVGARRYRLSRTSYRGIRFSFRGPTLPFVRLFVTGSLLSVLTLGVYYPVFITRRQAFMVSHSCFGSQRFGFDGRGRELIAPFLLGVLLFVPTLGLSWIWYSARRQRYFAEHTTFGAARFRSGVTGGRLLGLTLGNLLLLVLTLGVAWPWVIVRSLHFTLRYTALDGALDLAAVQQDTRGASATGEGLSSFLDADFGFH